MPSHSFTFFFVFYQDAYACPVGKYFNVIKIKDYYNSLEEGAGVAKLLE